MAKQITARKTYTYAAFTTQQIGVTMTHKGALSSAVRKAKAYAREAFAAWQYAGYGPTIVVRAENGAEVHRQRL